MCCTGVAKVRVQRVLPDESRDTSTSWPGSFGTVGSNVRVAQRSPPATATWWERHFRSPEGEDQEFRSPECEDPRPPGSPGAVSQGETGPTAPAAGGPGVGRAANGSGTTAV